MVAPHITAATPASGSAILSADTVYIEVYENGGTLLYTSLSVYFVGMGIEEVAWDGAAFTAAYAAHSFRTVVVSGMYGNGYGYTLIRDPVWPDSPRLTTRAFNTIGESNSNASSWTLTDPIAAVEPTVIPVFPSTSGPGPAGSDAPVRDAAYYLRLFDTTMPDWYLVPLKSAANTGYELFQAAAKIGARQSLAIQRFESLNLSMFSAGGSYATGTVEFYRESFAAGAVTVGAGTIVQCGVGGRGFITTQDAVFGASDLGPVAVAVRSLVKSFQYNVPGKVVTPVSGIELPGAIDTVRRMIQIDPATGLRTFIEPAMLVQNVNPTTGGAPAMLDQIGTDRGIIRGSGELDTKYRYRVRNLPDTVSPGAFRRLLDTIFDLYGFTYDFIETFEKDYQTCFDYPSDQVGTPTFFSAPLPADLIAHKDICVYDWPDYGDDIPMRNRWLDEVEHRATVIIGVPSLPAQRDVGMAYDDIAMVPTDRDELTGQITGRRALSAFDVLGTLDTAFGPQGGYDGFDLVRQGFYRALLQNLNAIKAAGVVVILELRGE